MIDIEQVANLEGRSGFCDFSLKCVLVGFFRLPVSCVKT